MAKAYHSISKLTVPSSTKLSKSVTHRHGLAFTVASSANKNEVPFQQKIKKSGKRVRKHLISISTSDGRWHGQWNCDYLLSLRELQLADLAEDGSKDAEVLVSLSVQKHAGFGFSVAGRIVSSFNRKCSCCSSPFCREIDTKFDVWVLPSSKNSELELPEIGWTDPSVIYVKPGSEADLDSLIQDTLRLTVSVKDTCSESCEKATVVWQSNDIRRTYDQRWSRLLELKGVQNRTA